MTKLESVTILENEFLPPGFCLMTEQFSIAEEKAYCSFFARLAFPPVVMRGRKLRRDIRAFGAGFNANFQSVEPAPPLPVPLRRLRSRVSQIFGENDCSFGQALVQRYPRSATIGWHRDSDQFGPTILGVSFLGAARMRFREHSTERTRFVNLPPRSVYILAGDSRVNWDHAVGAVTNMRYSVTFRSFGPD